LAVKDINLRAISFSEKDLNFNSSRNFFNLDLKIKVTNTHILNDLYGEIFFGKLGFIIINVNK
jgi:hypothetical protein